jgi:hypothetical protein
MTKRLPPLFETGLFGCPMCGDPDVEFNDFRTEGRSVLWAGTCHAHKWAVTMTMTPSGMKVRVTQLSADVVLPSHLVSVEKMTLEAQLRASLIAIGVDPDKKP